MIPKLITSDSFEYNDPSVSLVRFYSRGLDRGSLRKTAGHNVFEQFLQSFEPPKNRVVIHVLAVGDEEYYGPNRNCDAFSREDNRTAHSTFKDMGYVFRAHDHDDPLKAVGDVIATAHNENMSRIELLLGLDPARCPKEVQAVENGEDVPVSMGTAQDYDVCSYCKHKARTAKEHCVHIKKHLGKVAEDGTKIYMHNPRPKYFDISLVHKPADRIAYMLRKVAAESGVDVLGGHQLAEMFGYSPMDFHKLAAMRRVASIIKDVPCELQGMVSPRKLSKDARAELVKKAQIHGVEKLLSFLSENRFLLSPSDFGALVGVEDEDACDCAAHQYSDFNSLMDDPSTMQVFEPQTVSTPVGLSPDTLQELIGSTSMDAGPVQKRIIIISMEPKSSIKTANADPSFLKGFADLYNGYRLSFGLQHANDSRLLRDLAATF